MAYYTSPLQLTKVVIAFDLPSAKSPLEAGRFLRSLDLEGVKRALSEASGGTVGIAYDPTCTEISRILFKLEQFGFKPKMRCITTSRSRRGKGLSLKDRKDRQVS